MKKGMLLFTFLCCSVSIMLKAQSEFSAVGIYLQANPGNILQSHRPSSSPGHKQLSLAMVPLYDSIVVSQPYFGTLFNNRTYNFVYDANKNLLGKTFQEWNGGGWVNNARYSYTYNSNNLVTSAITQNWSGSAWVNQSRSFYYYNANNIDTNTINQIWNGSSWVNNSQYIYIYNANKLETNALFQNWNSGVWVNKSQSYYSYNAMNLDTNYLYKTWNGNAFVNNYQYISTYNANKLEITWIEQNWTNNAWVNAYTDTNFYNANNLDTSWVEEDWVSNSWSNYEKGTNTYNGGGETTDKEELAWISATWMYVSSNIYKYDSNNIMIANQDNYIGAGSQEVITRYYYHLSQATLVNEIRNAGNVAIYPNPNKGVFTIQSLVDSGQSLVEIYNELGQKIYQNQITNFNAPLNVSLMVPRGVYLVVLRNENSFMTSKIVIQR